MFLEEYRTGGMDELCAFCNRQVPTRGHHVVPRCKGGRDIVPTCHSCENFIHKTWTHNELRDAFNTVEKIQSDLRFQKFPGFTSSRKERFSQLDAIESEPASLTDNCSRAVGSSATLPDHFLGLVDRTTL